MRHVRLGRTGLRVSRLCLGTMTFGLPIIGASHPEQLDDALAAVDKETIMTRVASLDDYQNVARRMAEWATLPAGTDVVVFADHLKDAGAVAARLADFEVVVAMRERTAFPRALLERLPKLKLLI